MGRASTPRLRTGCSRRSPRRRRREPVSGSPLHSGSHANTVAHSAPPTALAAGPASRSRCPPRSSRMPKLLVIDDEPLICQSFQWVFAANGVEVATAATVADGWRHIEDDRPDVIVLDYQLPDGTGLDLFERI